MHSQSPRRAAWGICSVLIAMAGTLAACRPVAFDASGGSALASASRDSAASPSTSGDDPVAELPPGFPAPPQATRRERSEDDPTTVASWTSDAAGSAVYDFYIQALPAAGYPTTELVPGGSVAVIRFRVRDGSTWQLVLSREPGGGTLIQVGSAQP